MILNRSLNLRYIGWFLEEISRHLSHFYQFNLKYVFLLYLHM